LQPGPADVLAPGIAQPGGEQKPDAGTQQAARPGEKAELGQAKFGGDHCEFFLALHKIVGKLVGKRRSCGARMAGN
jgi:hypothetical protein